MIKELDSIIFDLDGTLWDSTETIAIAWQRALAELGYSKKHITANLVRSLAGMPYDAIYDKLFPEVKGAQRYELQSLCAKLELSTLQERGGVLYNNLKDTLQYLQGKYKLAIVSNCQSGYIETFLAYHQLQPYFTDHACYGTFSLPKSENIKEVIRRNNMQQAVYIGDTASDYEASQQANVPFILAAYGFGTVNAQVLSIDALSELSNLL